MPQDKPIDIDAVKDMRFAETNIAEKPFAVLAMGGRLVGPGHPCFIIAEAGVNHNGDIGLAKKLIDVAIEVGADAVKFQTFKTDNLLTRKAPKADYQMETTNAEESQFDMIKKLELSEAVHRELFDYCEKKGILFLSSPFDEESAGFLNKLGVSAFKIPSGEIINTGYLDQLARFGKPMIVSTGMADILEVEVAVSTIRAAGNKQIVLLQCVSNYPADPADANIRAMETMSRAFGVPVGYSDHVLRNEVAFAAVARGACIVEKHLTIDRKMSGPDHKASLDPEAFLALVKGIRIIETSLGDGLKRPALSEMETARVVRRSLVAARDLPPASILSREMIAIRRPGAGLPPSMLAKVIGMKTRKRILRNTPFHLEDLE